MRRPPIIASLLALIGLGLVLASVYAESLGIDPSPGWGASRVALFVLGIVGGSAAILARMAPGRAEAILGRLMPFLERLRRSRRLTNLARLARIYWPALPISMLVVIVYVWFASSATWTTWESPTRYFADLAKGFQRGHLYMVTKPSPGLLASPDPYELLPGGQIQGPIDVSYYQGRFYLPWGPTPALVVLLFRWLLHWWLGDLQLVFGFLCGIYIVESALAMVLWDRYFAALPRWPLWLALFVMGLAGPATFILNNYVAGRVHEAAITGAQFFFLCGLLCVVATLGRSAFDRALVAAGALWALAIAARVNLALPIGFVVVMIFGQQLKIHQGWASALARMLPFGLMLLLGIAALGWYNSARFGSPLETGYYYQLSLTRTRQHWQDLFSIYYVLPNLYNYLAGPPALGAEFPFLFADYGHPPKALLGNPKGAYYFAQMISGIAWLAPFAIFAVQPAVAAIRSLFRRGSASRPKLSGNGELPEWIVWVLLGTVLLSFGFLLVYYWAAMRFTEEFLPALMLLGVLGFWQGYANVRQGSGRSRFYSSVAILLAVFSIVISVLLGISANAARLWLLNHFAWLAR